MENKMKNYCKDCSFRNKNKHCENEKLHESSLEESVTVKNNDYLRYPYDEGGFFEVGDYFGCVHFKEKQEIKNA